MLEVAHRDTNAEARHLLFLFNKAIGRDRTFESASAQTLSEKLSVYTLAISQTVGLIYDEEYSIRDFVTMYLANPGSVHSMSEFAALWDVAFQSLDKNSFSVLAILCFLAPENIKLEIFQPESYRELPPGLGFWKEKFTE